MHRGAWTVTWMAKGDAAAESISLELADLGSFCDVKDDDFNSAAFELKSKPMPSLSLRSDFANSHHECKKSWNMLFTQMSVLFEHWTSNLLVKGLYSYLTDKNSDPLDCPCNGLVARNTNKDCALLWVIVPNKFSMLNSATISSSSQFSNWKPASRSANCAQLPCMLWDDRNTISKPSNLAENFTL